MTPRRFPYSPALAIGAAVAIAMGGGLIYAAAGYVTRTRIDDDLRLSLVLAVQALEKSARTAGDAATAAERVARAYRPRSTNLVIWDRDGQKEYNARQYLPPDDPAMVFLTVPKIDTVAQVLARHEPVGHDFVTAQSAQGPVRIHMREVLIEGRQLVVALTRSLAEVALVQSDFRRWALPWFLAVYLAAIVPAQLVVRRAIARVQRLGDEAHELGTRGGPARLSTGDSTAPIERMVDEINGLLSRQERDLESQRAVLALVSHELRTPVAILSAQAQNALDTDDAPVPELRATLRAIRQEAGALSRLVDDLFLIARSSAGEDIARPAPMYLDDLLRECTAATDVPGEEQVVLEVEEGNYSCLADDAMLRRAVTNLLANARRHAGREGAVQISLRTSGDGFIVEVWNNGPPIPPEDQPRIFDRFFQGRDLRGAAGLGLQVVRVVATAHGGDARLVSSTAEDGTRFRLTIPARIIS
jgi:signal transduction histidine kinase